jgi:hypothetical protein
MFTDDMYEYLDGQTAEHVGGQAKIRDINSFRYGIFILKGPVCYCAVINIT